MWTWHPVWLPSSSLSLGNWDSSSRKFIDIHHGYSHNSNLRPHKRNVALLQKCCIPKAREWILWKNTWRLIYWEGIPSGVTGALSALFTFFTLGEIGGRSQEAPREGSQSHKTPRNFLFGVFYVERTLISGECLRRQGFPTRFKQVIYAAAAQAGGDSPVGFCRPTVHGDDVLCMCLPGSHLKCGEECHANRKWDGKSSLAFPGP